MKNNLSKKVIKIYNNYGSLMFILYILYRHILFKLIKNVDMNPGWHNPLLNKIHDNCRIVNKKSIKYKLIKNIKYEILEEDIYPLQ